MEKQQVIEKIEKLIRLSKSSNPNEAAMAFAQAQKLMSKHCIEEQVLNASDEASSPKEPISDEFVNNMKRVTHWRANLIHSIAKNNHCEAFICVGNGVRVVGREKDIQTVRYLYSLFSEEIDRLTKECAYGKGKRYSNAFRQGCVAALKEKFAALQKETVAEVYQERKAKGMDLVAIDRSMKELKELDRQVQDYLGSFRLGKTYSRAVDASGYAHGKLEGQSLNAGNSAKRGLGSGNALLS